MCSPGVHTAASLCLKGKERMSLKILRILHKCADEIYFLPGIHLFAIGSKDQESPCRAGLNVVHKVFQRSLLFKLFTSTAFMNISWYTQNDCPQQWNSYSFPVQTPTV